MLQIKKSGWPDGPLPLSGAGARAGALGPPPQSPSLAVASRGPPPRYALTPLATLARCSFRRCGSGESGCGLRPLIIVGYRPVYVASGSGATCSLARAPSPVAPMAGGSPPAPPETPRSLGGFSRAKAGRSLLPLVAVCGAAGASFAARRVPLLVALRAPAGGARLFARARCSFRRRGFGESGRGLSPAIFSAANAATGRLHARFARSSDRGENANLLMIEKTDQRL